MVETVWADRHEPIRLSADVRTRELDDDLVLYHAGTDAVSHLDPIARTVWEALEDEPSFTDLITRLCAHFSADRNQVTADVSTLLDTLLASELISIEPQHSS